MNKALLVTLADRNFVDAAKQLFSSAYFNAGWKGDYMLLSVGIPDKELEWFRKKGILVKKYNLLRKTKIGASKRNPVVLSKFNLFNEEFKKWRNIIYLDADIIIRAPIDKLAKVKGFYAVRDISNHLLSEQFCNKKTLSSEDRLLLKELKREYNANKFSFNSGVMAFSTEMINEKTFDQLNSLFNKYKQIHNYGDQPTFNLFFYDKWKSLPPVYNVYSGVSYIKMRASKGIILHIFGGEKPWTINGSFYNEWNSNLKKAEFINLNKSLKGNPRWSSLKIYLYSKYLIFRENFFNWILYLNKKLKKNHPKFYTNLKKIKRWIN
ncbi:glycosyltransferase [Candidatus Pacearchaeota archaeon]|nr:glycosyltransferase [Candidatus Pacearchaeota archaeon]